MNNAKYIILGIAIAPFIIATAILIMWSSYIMIPILIVIVIAAMLKADDELDDNESRIKSKRRKSSSDHMEL
jgi:hypothetical protein